MILDDLKKVARESGVVGAGGAGFPSYAKMTEKCDTIIMNCVECEPLLKLHKQLLTAHADTVVATLDELRAVFGAKEAVIGLKNDQTHTINVLDRITKDYPHVRVCPVTPSYPMGDEVILIYEATGRVIKPAGLPIDEGVVVYNVETVFNLHRAFHRDHPVTDKIVSVVGEIDHPASVRFPIGTTVADAISSLGKITCENPAFIMGGPMMGCMGYEDTVITKTTNAIIILPENHKVVERMNPNIEIERKRAASSCCQCRTCTDLCPRHALGHPIEPHKIMRAVANHDVSDLSAFINSSYCSSCGLCEKFACPQSLSPRTVIAEFKNGLRAAGIRPEKIEKSEVVVDRELRKAPVKRLKQRLDLAKYDVPAPLHDICREVSSVKILMSQHIGAPAIPCVKVGDFVKTCDLIGKAADGLSVNIHASIDGKVVEVTDKYVYIEKV